ncbi:hypothetical protein R5R35_011035 [Gryllus longicercus]|uniref:Uncharacterized protein n=1 Tax=Gryllus longicercus TaxID=2509291 RepID=A0AAN9VJ27_9ORTH
MASQVTVSQQHRCQQHESKPHRYATPSPGEEVVISGVAGRFPECDDMQALHDALQRGECLLTTNERRWNIDHPEMPKRTGKMHRLEKFDASFFRVHFKQAHAMDPQCRLLLERAYEAIVDAGINPKTLRGKRMGVYVGACFSEAEKTLFYEKVQVSGMGITGCCRAMLSNRISYWLGAKGPSYTTDTACSSALFSFKQAYEALSTGEVDYALVGGTNLLLHPHVSLQFMQLGVLSKTGKCSPFDEDSNGYVRAEAIGAVFLQRAKDARRVYATVVNAAVNCDGYKEQGITYPSGQAQAELMRDTCRDAGVDPGNVVYVEAHGTGTRVGDPVELSAIDKAFCLETSRKDPLLVGTIKANLGHTEPVSGLISVTKVILAMESGVIPPTINHKRPRRGITALTAGRIKVVTEATPWQGGLVAVNSFGFGGANALVLLRSPSFAHKPPLAHDQGLPRLVLASGRTREAVDVLLDEVARHTPPHQGLVQLMHALHEVNTPGHIYRGFVVAGDASAPATGRDVQHWSGERRPVWFVFAGMGSQWPAMGAALMRLPLFAAAVQRCHAVLAPRGVDIVTVLTSNDPAVLHNILHCFVGIATVQVGLVDVLRAVGIEPDVIIGHSAGELGCAYADGCLTAEQTVLAAYERGRATLEAQLVPGAMAAVGLSAAEVAPLCPPDVDVACHNGPDSATISGPAASLRAFVESLKARGVFAKEVACGGIAYHSRYIAPAGELLLRSLKEVIPEPRPRSARWLSSSVGEAAWGLPEAQLCSAEYQTNNILQAVLFEPLLTRVPENAVAIEIAPHGLLQAILKRALPSDVLNVPLTRRGADSLNILFNAIGRLYNAGLQPKPSSLYPPPQWPVPRGTPMISPLVRWSHEGDWFVPSYRLSEKSDTAERLFCLNSQEDETEIVNGHIIDGRELIPATGYLKLAWQLAASLEGKLYSEVPVVFENVRFLRATKLPRDEGETQELTVNVHRASGDWEVSDNGTVVACGRVRIPEDVEKEMISPPLQQRAPRTAPADAEEAAAAATRDAAATKHVDNAWDNAIDEEEEEVLVPAAAAVVGEELPDFDLSAKHVYKCLRLRGYNYQGPYRGIYSATIDGTSAHIRWNNNWVAYLDALLQMKIVVRDSTQLYVPTSIQKMVVHTRRHLNEVNLMSTKRKLFQAQLIPELNLVTTGAVEIRGLHATPIPRRRTLAEPVLEHYEFVPYGSDAAAPSEEREWETAEALRVCVQLVQENRLPVTRTTPPVRVAEVVARGLTPLAPLLLAALADLPLVQAKATLFLEEGAEAEAVAEAGAGLPTADASKLAAERDLALLVLSDAGEGRSEALASAAVTLGAGGCLLARALAPGAVTALRTAAAAAGLQLALRMRVRGGAWLLLFRKGGWSAEPAQLHVVRVPELAEGEGEGEAAFAWVERLQAALRDPNPAEKRVALVARGPLNGALGLFNCLRQEPGAGPQLARLYLLPEEADVEDGAWDDAAALLERLRPRLELDLAVNVLQGGRWGCMRHLPLAAAPSVPVRHAFCETAVRGDLSSIGWFQGRIDPDRPLLAPGHSLVHVSYAALNFRDVMMASGKLDTEIAVCDDPDSIIGFEFSGRLTNGRRVMGMKMGGCLSTEVVAPNYLLWEVPEEMTLLQASTVPTAYATVVYALEMVGRMAAGESVLVHAASGAVGQAALTLALARGCRVFATVGTQQKKDFLLRAFPQMAADDIGSSRDLSFEPLVLRRTGGRGVDLVLNSLADDKLQASLRCLAPCGRFLEIGKVDIQNNSAIGMRTLQHETSIHGIMLDLLTVQGDTPRMRELKKRLQRLLDERVVRPVNAEVLSRDQVEHAIRHMAAGKHIGKVVIRVREGEEERGHALSKPLTLPARPRFYCQPDASYVLVGGLGGLGLELAHWMVQRGARHLVLVSRRGVTTGYQARRLQQWRAKGVRALVRTDDASTRRGAEALLRAAGSVAPVAAIFNLAVVLRDALLENQTAAAFAESFRCKATAAVQLDAASRRLCPRLRHFVLFSSVSCGRGNAGQTNYGLANAVMERVARARRAAGLPATAVQWGAVGDVGLVADMRDDDRVLEIGGTLQQRLTSCLDVLDGFLAQTHAVVASMVVAEKRAGAGDDDLVTTMATMLGFRDLKQLSLESTLAELGMDSMMAVEIQQTLARDFDILLSPQDVRALTFGRLREYQRTKNTKTKRTPVGFNGSASTLAVPDRTNHVSVTLHQLINAVVDELTATKTVVPLASNETNELVITDNVAIAFPGVEGVTQSLELLSRGLCIKSVALQLPFHDVKPSVSLVADHLMPHVKEQLRGAAGDATSNGYVLLGYSYGGLLALEAAARLEAEGVGTEGMSQIVLLDSAPDLLRALISEFGARHTVREAKNEILDNGKEESESERMENEALQIELLLHITQVETPDASPSVLKGLREELQRKTSWQDRLQIFAEHSPDTKHREYTMAAVDAIYKRVLSVEHYRWPKDRPRLKASVVLIRPSASPLPTGILSEDGGLSQICERPVSVHYVEGADHYTLPSNHQTAALVNAALEAAHTDLAKGLKGFRNSPEVKGSHITEMNTFAVK